MSHWLDDLARSLASGVSRRDALRRLGVGAAGALLAPLLPTADAAEAAPEGLADCVRFCSRYFKGDARRRCVADAGQGRGPCFVCGPEAKDDKRQPCRDRCCPEGLACIDKRCVDCPESRECNGTCCPEGQRCDPATQQCGRDCGGDVCGKDEICCTSGSSRTCVNPKTDEQNCGGCGRRCPDGSTCVNGICSTCPSNQVCGRLCCPTGEVCANGRCTNLAEDPDHCGAEGTRCPAAQPHCCDGKCVNRRDDENNCGVCNRVCPQEQACIGGRCQSCPAERICGPLCCRANARCDQQGRCRQVCGTQLCEPDAACCRDVNNNPVCIDVDRDPNNCGRCTHKCPTDKGATCIRGRCICLSSGRPACGQNCCADGFACREGECVPLCDGDICGPRQACCTVEGEKVCLNVTENPDHCGACDAPCGQNAFCVDRVCTACSGTACGRFCCDLNEACVDGRCVRKCGGASGTVTCQPGQICCKEGTTFVCRDARTDEANCGACGRRCPEDTTCLNGFCTTCALDQVCDRRCCPENEVCCQAASGGNVCVNLSKNEQHCGACNKPCDPGKTCCSGGCIDRQSDPRNCGVCNRVCPLDTFCVDGRCRGCSESELCGNECCAEGEVCGTISGERKVCVTVEQQT